MLSGNAVHTGCGKLVASMLTEMPHEIDALMHSLVVKNERVRLDRPRSGCFPKAVELTAP